MATGYWLLTFFSVSFSQRRCLQIWWLLSLRQGAHSPQLSLRWQPTHSPQRLRFFFDCKTDGQEEEEKEWLVVVLLVLVAGIKGSCSCCCSCRCW